MPPVGGTVVGALVEGTAVVVGNDGEVAEVTFPTVTLPLKAVEVSTPSLYVRQVATIACGPELQIEVVMLAVP